MKQGHVGRKLVDEVLNHLRPESVVAWDDDGFTHWRYGLAQRIGFQGPYDRTGIYVADLSFETDFLRALDGSEASLFRVAAKLNESPGLFVPAVVGDRLKLRGRRFVLRDDDFVSALMVADFALWSSHVAREMARSSDPEWRDALAGTTPDMTCPGSETGMLDGATQLPSVSWEKGTTSHSPVSLELDHVLAALSRGTFSTVVERSDTSVTISEGLLGDGVRVLIRVDTDYLHRLVGPGTRVTSTVEPSQGGPPIDPEWADRINEGLWSGRRDFVGVGTWLPTPRVGLENVSYYPGRYPDPDVVTDLVRQAAANTSQVHWHMQSDVKFARPLARGVQ